MMNDIPPNITTVIVAILGSTLLTNTVPQFFSWIATTIFDKEKKATIDDVMVGLKEVKENTEKNTKSIEELSDRLTLVDEKTMEMSAVTSRRRILRFNDEVVNNKTEIPIHSKEHWLEILRDIDDYENYTENHPDFKNSYAVESIRNLRSTWVKIQERHLL